MADGRDSAWSLMHSQGEVNELAVLFSFFIFSIQPRISSHGVKRPIIKLSLPTSVKITYMIFIRIPKDQPRLYNLMQISSD